MAIRDINMIPWEDLERINRQRHVKFWIKLWALVLFISIIGYGVQNLWLRSNKLQTRDTGVTSDDITAKLNRVSQLQDQIQSQKSKQQTLARIVRRQVFYDNIAMFSNSLNESVWVESFTIKRDDEEKDQSILVCEGYSENHHALGLFLDQISIVPRITEVVLEQADSLDASDAGAKYPGMIKYKVSCMIMRYSKNEN
jgi:hypothetical protein